MVVNPERILIESQPITSANSDVTVVVSTCEKKDNLVSFSALIKSSVDLITGNVIRLPWRLKSRLDIVGIGVTSNTTTIILLSGVPNATLLSRNSGKMTATETYAIQGSYYTDDM